MNSHPPRKGGQNPAYRPSGNFLAVNFFFIAVRYSGVMGKTIAQQEAELRAAFLVAVNQQLPLWIAGLERNGVDRSMPMGSMLNEPTRVSSGWGHRSVSASGPVAATSFHRGVDFTTVARHAEGTVDVHSIVDGRILFIGEPSLGSGQSMVIGGNDGYVYTIAHLRAGSTARHRIGEHVGRDDVVAIMGRTGSTTAECVHAVKYPLPGFEAFSAGHRAGALGDHIAPSDFSAYVGRLGGRSSINWDRFERGVPVLGWPNHSVTPEQQMARGTHLPANDERDRYPHVYAMQGKLTNYYMNHPWPHVMGPKPHLQGDALKSETAKALFRVMGLHPERNAPSARLEALDAQIYAFSRHTPANAEVKLHVGWMTPEMQANDRAHRQWQQAQADSQTVTSRIVCAVTFGNAWCPPPPPSPPRGNGHQR
jgi:hypothetical protein